jgi:hypothetical protein
MTATANLNPWAEAKVDTKNPDRGPLLLISGERDHTVPWAIVNASYNQQQDNKGVIEIEKMPGRGHALIIDSGWREVADTALAFVQRFTWCSDVDPYRMSISLSTAAASRNARRSAPSGVRYRFRRPAS